MDAFVTKISNFLSVVILANWNLSDQQLSFAIYSCIKKNTSTLESIVTIPIMINIMEVKLFEIGLST